ncbi:hypothetical protein P8452_71821 [Trifolium repens]|nr:protein argonaute [Trifolium repens]WJX89858.1 hypothetical protein P8452_71821 [Trifolium repens]
MAATYAICTPKTVIDFLIASQNLTEGVCLNKHIKWDKAKETLKNLRITVGASNTEYKITGLTEEPGN